MADSKITELTELTSVADEDLLPIVDDPSGSPVTKRITKENLVSGLWPIGSVFIAVVATNPATLLGFGTWSAFGAGRVLIGLDSGDVDFDTVEETGGAKTVASSAQSFAGTVSTVVVNHVHVQNLPGGQTGNFASGTRDTSAGGTGGSCSSTPDVLSTTNPTGGSANYTPAGTNTPGAATSVVQPYIVVYMWKRTA